MATTTTRTRRSRQSSSSRRSREKGLRGTRGPRSATGAFGVVEALRRRAIVRRGHGEHAIANPLSLREQTERARERVVDAISELVEVEAQHLASIRPTAEGAGDAFGVDAGRVRELAARVTEHEDVRRPLASEVISEEVVPIEDRRVVGEHPFERDRRSAVEVLLDDVEPNALARQGVPEEKDSEPVGMREPIRARRDRADVLNVRRQPLPSQPEHDLADREHDGDGREGRVPRT